MSAIIKKRGVDHRERRRSTNRFSCTTLPMLVWVEISSSRLTKTCRSVSTASAGLSEVIWNRFVHTTPSGESIASTPAVFPWNRVMNALAHRSVPSGAAKVQSSLKQSTKCCLVEYLVDGLWNMKSWFRACGRRWCENMLPVCKSAKP